MQRYYVIKVDYFVYDETKEDGVGREPKYLYTMRNKFKVYVFRPTLSEDNLDLKWFETKKDAETYIKERLLKKSTDGIINIPCYDNVRVEEVEYTI